MASAFDVSALTDYVEVHKDELLVKATLGAKSFEYIDIMPGVKHKDAIPVLDSTIELQDGSNCGWNPKGTDAFSTRTIEVHPIKVEKEFCWKDFRKKYANYQLQWEAGREKLPFEEKVAESNLAKIQEANEKLVWQGDTSLGVTGFIADVSTASASIKSAAYDASSAVKTVDAIYGKLTSVMLKKGVNIFMAPSGFRKYVQEMNATCCANQPVIDANQETLKYVGDSRVTLIPVEGLEGKSLMIFATPDALVYGTDIENADNVYRMFYMEKEDMVGFRVLYEAGTALRWPDETGIAD